jgi:hypothetical protein
MTVLDYRRGQEQPGVSFGWEDAAGTPIDFSLGFTFVVQLVGRDGVAVLTKTTGIVGVADGVDITWAPGELNIPAGSYRLLLTARDESSNDRAFNPANPPVLRIFDPAIGA